MTAVKTRVGLLYQHSNTEECKRVYNIISNIKTALTSRCPGVDISADVVVDDNKDQPFMISDADREKLQSVEILVTYHHTFPRCNFEFTNLRWLQNVAAGVDGVTRNIAISKLPQFIMTRDAVSYPDCISQYVLGYTLAHERHLVQHYHNQQIKLWHELRHRDPSILTLGILGVGRIGKRIAEVVKNSLNMTVWGYVRTLPSATSHCSSVDEYRTGEKLPELLSNCDYVCNVLPSTPSTDGLLDGDILSHCRHKKCVFINVGRGNIIKNSTIIHALNEGWLSHAILDVFEKEPLPEDSELWTHPHVTITPHVAGYETNYRKFIDEFSANFERYKSNQPMNHVVDWSKGY